MASLAASARRAGVRPYHLKYSWADGSNAPFMRSFCNRSIITTSTSFSPVAMSWWTWTPSFSTCVGISVRGPTTRTSGTPRVVRA